MKTDWNNIDLACESHLSLVDGLTFGDLLTEINSNLPEITEETVRIQFERDLTNRILEARGIFALNLKNIVAYAIKERQS